MSKTLPPLPTSEAHREIFKLRHKLSRANEEKGRLIDELMAQNSHLRRQVREQNVFITQLAKTMRESFMKCLTYQQVPEEAYQREDKEQEICVYSEFDIDE